jgi:hypothetical protein
MRHPFEGIEPKATSNEQSAIRTRRSFFALVAGTVATGVAGLIGLSSSANAQATLFPIPGRPPVLPPPRPPGPGNRPTTLAIGEEGGRPRPRPTGWKK